MVRYVLDAAAQGDVRATVVVVGTARHLGRKGAERVGVTTASSHLR